MKVASQKEVAADFAEYVKATKQGPVIVTSKGKPVVVLLRSGSEDDVERLLMSHSPDLQSILQAARKWFREGRGIPHEKLWVHAYSAAAAGELIRSAKGAAGYA